jgi:hypothetical protein
MMPEKGWICNMHVADGWMTICSRGYQLKISKKARHISNYLLNVLL